MKEDENVKVDSEKENEYSESEKTLTSVGSLIMVISILGGFLFGLSAMLESDWVFVAVAFCIAVSGSSTYYLFKVISDISANLRKLLNK